MKPYHESQKQCVFSTTGIAKFTETHCLKDCQWLVYGKMNINIPHGYIGICCALREVLEIDFRNNKFLRLKPCIDQTKPEKGD
jgi:hypothetical protein